MMTNNENHLNSAQARSHRIHCHPPARQTKAERTIITDALVQYNTMECNVLPSLCTKLSLSVPVLVPSLHLHSRPPRCSWGSFVRSKANPSSCACLLTNLFVRSLTSPLVQETVPIQAWVWHSIVCFGYNISGVPGPEFCIDRGGCQHF